MALSFEELKKVGAKLCPVPVDITGIDEPVLIHQFTLNQVAVLDGDKREDAELSLRRQVLRFLMGFDAEITDNDCKELGDYFAGWQIREIYTKALKLNGFGPESLREAEKN